MAVADLSDVLDRVTGAGADLNDGQQQTPPGRQLVPLAGGGQMSRRRQLFAAITQGCRQARRNWEAAKKRPGGPIHWFENWKPESVAETLAYRDSKAWVPTGHEGGTADTVGTFDYSTIAPWAKRVIHFADWIVERQFRAYVALGLVLLTGGVTAGLLLH